MITAFLPTVCEPAAIAETGRRSGDVDGVRGTETHLAIRSYGRADEAAAFDIGVD